MTRTQIVNLKKNNSWEWIFLLSDGLSLLMNKLSLISKSQWFLLFSNNNNNNDDDDNDNKNNNKNNNNNNNKIK